MKNSNYFEATNTPFILRGLLRCPFCGTNMVSGQIGGKRRNTRRYYVCGAYQRKGKSVCKFKSLDKETTEQAVIDALIREMSVLLHPGMLAEELARSAQKQTEKQRLELVGVEKEIELAAAHGVGDEEYPRQLSESVAELVRRKSALQAEIESAGANVEIVEAVRNQLRYFVEHIRIEPYDKQNATLKQWVRSIKVNLVSEVMDVHIVLGEKDAGIGFEKHLFISLE